MQQKQSFWQILAQYKVCNVSAGSASAKLGLTGSASPQRTLEVSDRDGLVVDEAKFFGGLLEDVE